MPSEVKTSSYLALVHNNFDMRQNLGKSNSAPLGLVQIACMETLHVLQSAHFPTTSISTRVPPLGMSISSARWTTASASTCPSS
jgi:hypothetical protein